jgi:hypothetical protein
VVVGPEQDGSFAHCPSGTVAVGGCGQALEAFLYVSEPLVGEQVAANGQTGAPASPPSPPPARPGP